LRSPSIRLRQGSGGQVPHRDGSGGQAFGWLLRKEWRELLSSRAWWVMVLVIGPIVGVSFIDAVRTYGELSGYNASAGGVGEAFSPLVGVWAPTFSACELAAAFLLPFVGIRLVAGDRQTGALRFELQHSMSALTRMTAKALVLLGGWIIASAAPLVAVVLWRAYGGTLYPPELASVAAGHLLNAGISIALAACTAAISEHPSTAAILTLSVTVGTWILNFVAAVHGGVWERAAGFTPTAMVADFQHGLIRLDAVLAALVLILLGLALAACWLRPGVPAPRRARECAALTAVAAALVLASARLHPTWDVSEDRQNSFARADEEALSTIGGPLRIEVHLAPEDPRRVDFERHAAAKLRRVLPSVDIRYTSATSIGMFEQTNQGYGEIWYEVEGRRTMSRAVTVDGVLEAIYSVAAVEPPRDPDAEIFRGHPLAVPPRGAALVFYFLWPATVLAAAAFTRWRHS
jgi:ABC-2 type transport system permease protein